MSDVKRYEWDEDDGGWYCEGFTPVAGESLVLASDYDALAARLAEAERLLRAWDELDFEECTFGDYCAVAIDQHAFDEARNGLDDFMRPSDSAPAVTCDHFPGQTACEWCHGTGAIDAPTSADDPSCPDCDGEGHV